MKRIEDDRVLFYIRHQELIDVWTAAGNDYYQLAHDFYLSLAEDLEAAANDLGDDVGVYTGEAGYSHLGLRRDGWVASDGNPILLAGFEWRRSRTGFVGGYRICGIRVDMSSSLGKQVRSQLGDRVRSRREALGYPKRTNWWPAYRSAPDGSGDYWEDLEPLRRALVDEVVEVWDTFIGDLDAVSLPNDL